MFDENILLYLVKMIDGAEEVFDILNVEDHNSYISNGYLHHNCQTPDQIIHIYDTKLDKYIDVSFEELHKLIEEDNELNQKMGTNNE